MTTFSETFSMAYSREPYAIALIGQIGHFMMTANG